NLVIVQIFTEWELATLKNWISTHETDGLAEELDEVVILCGQIPVEPANRVVLTISVVIATLSPGELVAAEQHRRAGRKEQRTRVVLHELQPEREHAGVGRFALGAAVPGVVVVSSVVFVLAVRLVVLAVVRNKIVERESVMASDEVKAVIRRAAVVTVKVCRAGEPPA